MAAIPEKVVEVSTTSLEALASLSTDAQPFPPSACPQNDLQVKSSPHKSSGFSPCLYDEFGNYYIGPEIDSDVENERGDDDVDLPDRTEDEDALSDREHEPEASNGWLATDVNMDNSFVLAEDKKYYPTAEEVYSEEFEALVVNEDEQPFEQQIIKPVKNLKSGLGVEDSSTDVSTQFLLGLMSNPTLVRNVALVGHLHHGKTVFMDMLVEQTHHISTFDEKSEKHMRYTDTRIDERGKRISIKAVPMSLVLEDSYSKSYLCNIMDTPGHVNFSDEMTAALRLADGAVLIVDAADGVMVNTERAIRHAIQDRLPIVVVINKVDRLITELKLLPKDAYHKLRDIIKAINTQISAASSTAGSVQVIDPVIGNVCFASASAGWSFTLQSFAKLYVKRHGVQFDASTFASCLWGDYYYDPETRVFKKEQPSSGAERSFVEFVLKTLYKIYSQVTGEHKKSVEATLAELGVTLSNAAYRLNVRRLLGLACSSVFGSLTGFIDMLVHHIPSAKAAASKKVEHIYTGAKRDSAIYQAMEDCDANGPLMVNVTKLYPKSDCSVFGAFGRVYSGKIMTGQTLRVLREGYSPDDEEDTTVKEVTKLWVYQARNMIPISEAPPGSWVLIEGVDASIMKTATLCNHELDEDVCIFRPLQFKTLPVVKTATEPLNPNELPKMVEGLRTITKVEESGEHTILGTGELYIDSIMKDVRELYSEVEVKVADPVVSFCETVVESSSMKCFAEAPNKKNKITMVAEPLERGLAEDIENSVVSIDWPKKRLGEFFQTKYDWDLLAARSIWEFGPDKQEDSFWHSGTSLFARTYGNGGGFGIAIGCEGLETMPPPRSSRSLGSSSVVFEDTNKITRIDKMLFVAFSGHVGTIQSIEQDLIALMPTVGNDEKLIRAVGHIQTTNMEIIEEYKRAHRGEPHPEDHALVVDALVVGFLGGPDRPVLTRVDGSTGLAHNYHPQDPEPIFEGSGFTALANFVRRWPQRMDDDDEGDSVRYVCCALLWAITHDRQNSGGVIRVLLIDFIESENDESESDGSEGDRRLRLRCRWYVGVPSYHSIYPLQMPPDPYSPHHVGRLFPSSVVVPSYRWLGPLATPCHEND